jgi:hypothetical protein
VALVVEQEETLHLVVEQTLNREVQEIHHQHPHHKVTMAGLEALAVH